MGILDRLLKRGPDEDDDLQLGSEFEETSSPEEASTVGLLSKLRKRRKNDNADGLELDGDPDTSSNSVEASPDVDGAETSSGDQTRGLLEPVSEGSGGVQAAPTNLFAAVGPVPVVIVDGPEGKAEATETEAPPEPASPERPVADDSGNALDGLDLSLKDIFLEQEEENECLRDLAASVEAIDAAELAAQLRSLVDEIRNS